MFCTFWTYLSGEFVIFLKINRGVVMTTEKQIVANIQNAQYSTGPTTMNGKAIVATNAIKHGIFTKDLSGISRTAQSHF
jgi:hypothetical protein